MAAKKYIERNALTGRLTEVEGTQVSQGAADAGELVALGEDGKLDPTVLPVGFGDEIKVLTAGETLTAGDFVAINTAGEVVRASAASGGRPAIGFVLESVAAAAQVAIYFEGTNTDVTGAVPGQRVYLSDTVPGGFTQTPVVGPGKLHQTLGFVILSTEISFEAGEVVVLA